VSCTKKTVVSSDFCAGQNKGYGVLIFGFSDTEYKTFDIGPSIFPLIIVKMMLKIEQQQSTTMAPEVDLKEILTYF